MWRDRWKINWKACGGLLISDCAALTSQMIAYVALPWWITNNGGARDLATYAIVVAVATLLSVPLLSPFSERWPKRTQIVFGTVALLVASILVAYVAFSSGYNLLALTIIAICAVIASSFVNSASANVAAEIVHHSRLPDLLSLQKSAQSFGRILGPLLGGLFIAVGGVRLALIMEPAFLVIATIAATRIPGSHAEIVNTEARSWTGAVRQGIAARWSTLGANAISQSAEPDASHAETQSWTVEFRNGLIAKWNIPLERGWTLVNFFMWIFVGPAVTMLVPLKIQSLNLGGSWLGIAEAAVSVGMLSGALVGPELLVSRYGRFSTRLAAAVFQGVFLVVVGFSKSKELLIIALLLTGFCNSIMVLIGLTHRILAVPQTFRVRMTAVNVSTTQIASMIGPVIASLSLTHFSLPHVYAAFGAASGVAALGFCFLPRAREFFALDHTEVTNWYHREYPRAFDSSATLDVA